MNSPLSGHTFICHERQQHGYPCNCQVPVLSQMDEVNHPRHYTQHPAGIECIAVVEQMNFNLGNAVKYVWRAGLKSPDAIKDLLKAAWYINREILRLRNAKEYTPEEHRASTRSATD